MSDEHGYVPLSDDETERPQALTGLREGGRYTNEQMKRARELLTRIYAIMRAANFYDFEHPAVGAAIETLFHVIDDYFVENVDVQLVFLDGTVLLGEQLLTSESVLFDQLIRDFTAAGVGSITFRQGMPRSELMRAMKMLVLDAGEIAALGGLEAVVASSRLSLVEIGLVGVIEQGSTDDMVELTEDARAAFGNAVSVIREIQSSLQARKMPKITGVTGVTKSLVDNVLSNRSAMLQMSSLKSHHEYTYYHSANVAILSVALASTITRDTRFLSALGSGALLHDIGKLAVGLDIIDKPGALTPEEWDRMRQHPTVGTQIASQMKGVDRSVLVPIFEHHMRWDGSGYPSRTPRRKQHITSRIVAVADSYDAMTSKRSYSAARIQDEAMRLIVESAGNSLDPVLVTLFVRMMGAYPPRSVVKLSDGAVGVVIAPSEDDPYRPIVRVLTAPNGGLITPVDVNLGERPGISIEGLIDPNSLNIQIDDYL